MRISDLSSDVCSSDLPVRFPDRHRLARGQQRGRSVAFCRSLPVEVCEVPGFAMAVEGLAIVVDLVGKHSLRARGVEADIEATAASLLRQGSARLLQHCLTEGADCPFFDLESHRYHDRRRLPYGARKSVVSGKRVSVRVNIGGRRI